jgi:ABC-type amino acid transport system permease subunit
MPELDSGFGAAHRPGMTVNFISPAIVLARLAGDDGRTPEGHVMFALAISGTAFVCAIGAGLLGMWFGPRLPADHVSDDAKEIAKMVLAILGTLTALVLGLLIASAKSSLDSKIEQIKQAAARTVELDRTLAQYGPETQEMRDRLQKIAESRVRWMWPGHGVTAEMEEESISRGRGIEAIQRQLLHLTPRDEAQRWFKTTALDITNDIAETRWMGLLNISGGIQTPFLVVLIFWLTAIFASIGIFSPRNAHMVATLAVCALSVSGAIFLIVEMDRPFSGFIQVPISAVTPALNELNKP